MPVASCHSVKAVLWARGARAVQGSGVQRPHLGHIDEDRRGCRDHAPAAKAAGLHGRPSRARRFRRVAPQRLDPLARRLGLGRGRRVAQHGHRRGKPSRADELRAERDDEAAGGRHRGELLRVGELLEAAFPHAPRAGHAGRRCMLPGRRGAVRAVHGPPVAGAGVEGPRALEERQHGLAPRRVSEHRQGARQPSDRHRVAPIMFIFESLSGNT